MHGEGLALNVSGTYNYQYNINDHLGNTRVVQNATKAVEQRNDYYPFGLAHSVANLQKNKYLYNGKESQDETLSGTLFGELDYGARFYDPVIARFKVQDRFAEKYYGLSPYNYCAGNPINCIDINGDSIWVTMNNYGYDKNGIYTVVSTSDYYYDGSKLIDRDGNSYEGNNEFAQQFLSALKKLNEGKNGRNLVSFFMNSEKNVTISQSWLGNTADMSKSKILWNSTEKYGGLDVNGGYNTADPFVMLGHEMQHIKNLWDGNFNNKKWATSYMGNRTPYDEISATHTENLIRAEHGIPLRASYNHDGNYGVDKATQIVRINSMGVYESVYYNNNGTANQGYSRVKEDSGYVY